MRRWLPQPQSIGGLIPYATGDKPAVSGEVNRMIAAAINVDPRWFWHGPEA